VTFALVLAALLQGQTPEVSASVDRTRLAVGDELVFTILARTRAPEPLDLVPPQLSGFAIVGTRDLTDVSTTGPEGSVRTLLRELRLRAARPGAGLIGPVRARQGDETVETAPIRVTIDSAGSSGALGSLARALVDRAAPPGGTDDVALTVVASADTVFAGQQLDIVAVAWFPRGLRDRLRRPPVLRVVSPAGAWAGAPAAPAGVATSRRAGDEWMDLFVVHQVVFPLAPGRLVVPPASVEYAVPITYSFFSREERYSLHSDSLPIAVLAPPAAGRPSDDHGVVGERITLRLAVEPAEARVGEPMDVVVTAAGAGNAALWPEPVVHWPPGLRAYPTEPTLTLAPAADGLLRGARTFRFLVVPDSAGTLVLPRVRYPYYDVAARAYAVAETEARTLVVAPGAEPRAARALPPLLAAGAASRADRLAGALWPWGWVAVLILPPLLVLGLSRGPWISHGPMRHPGPTGPTSPLGRLEAEFQHALAGLVADPEARASAGLGQALRAAGVEGPVAGHIVRLRDRLQAARYGSGAPDSEPKLVAELERALRALGGGVGAGRRSGVAIVVALAAFAGRGGAQAPGAEALYDAGALRAAADSFAARAAAAPAVAAHWYNLGVTLYRAGADGRASAVLLRAARLAPRDPVIRRARALLPAPDAASDPLLAVGAATPGEWALVAAVAWLGLWGLVVVRRGGALMNQGPTAALAALALTALTLGGLEARRRARPVSVVAAPTIAVRVAPYGSASAAATLDAGAALLAGRRHGAWLEVRRERGSVHGWVRADEMVRVGP